MGEATKQYYLRKIQELELQLHHKNLELESIMVQCYDLGTQGETIDTVSRMYILDKQEIL